MPSIAKEKFVADLTEELKKSEHLLVTDYQGLTTAELNDLRAQLLKIGSKYKIIKNRLARIAFKKLGWAELEPQLKGPSGIAYLGKDASGLAKIVATFGKEHKNLKIKGGVLFKQAANSQVIKEIASLPSREVLIATLLSRLNSPLTTFVATLSEPLRALARGLSAVAKKKEAVPAS